MYKVQLNNFEGPIDLLLYFIRRDELDIYDIPISEITREFVRTVEEWKKMHLHVAGDFIDDVLMPFINPVIANFTTKKSKGKKGGVIFSVQGSDIEINLERVLASSIKFFALSIIIFFMLQFGVTIKKPVQWVSVRNWDSMSKSKKKNRTKGVGKRY